MQIYTNVLIRISGRQPLQPQVYLALENTSIYRTGATWALKELLECASEPQGHSKWSLERSPGPQRRSKSLLEPEPQRRSKEHSEKLRKGRESLVHWALCRSTLFTWSL